MLLAIDAGNTNIVFAVYDGDRRKGSWRISTDHNRTADEYAVWLIQLMAMARLKPRDVTDAILGSVVPAATFHLLRLCQQHFHCKPMVVGDQGLDLGVKALIDSPKEVGADRLLNSVAAHAAYPSPLVVVDFGTATNFDIVDADGNFAGGVIAPGINLSMEALHRAAAKLPKVEVARPERVIGKHTIGAMQSGIFWGYVGLIEGLLARIEAEFGSPMTVIATGGLAPLFSAAIPAIAHVDDDLTLRGLLLVFKRNQRP
jgi:type III pantothenate kinase